MRHLAIGDIHGCYAALEALVGFAPYAEAETVVFLGDYVDRGPRSREVLDWLIGQQQERRIVTLRGNHEIMMLDARIDEFALQEWLHFGGDDTLRSYGTKGRVGELDDVPEKHWQFLESTLPVYEAETEFFVHAGVDPQRPLDGQPDDVLYWEKFDETGGPHANGKRMICGHTSQQTGLPLDIGHAVCIDTWVYGAGWLTALDVQTGRWWQANEYGMTRTGRLSNDE